MAPRIHERTRDRVSAVQVLYTSELTGKSPSELLDCGLCLVAREAPARWIAAKSCPRRPW